MRRIYNKTPHLETTLFVKRCPGDIWFDKMAISIRGFTGFLAPVGFGLCRRDFFHRGELDETRAERLQK